MDLSPGFPEPSLQQRRWSPNPRSAPRWPSKHSPWSPPDAPENGRRHLVSQAKTTQTCMQGARPFSARSMSSTAHTKVPNYSKQTKQSETLQKQTNNKPKQCCSKQVAKAKNADAVEVVCVIKHSFFLLISSLVIFKQFASPRCD